MRNVRRAAQFLTAAIMATWALSAAAGPSMKGPLGNGTSAVDEYVRVQAFGTNLRTVNIAGLTMAPGGAAHPTKTYVGLTIDMDSGKALTIRDMFGPTGKKGPGRDAVTAIARYSRQALKKELGEYYSPGLVKRLPSTFANFEYTPKGLRVGYQLPFVIGPRAVTVPWSKLPARQVKQYGGL